MKGISSYLLLFIIALIVLALLVFIYRQMIITLIEEIFIKGIFG